MNNCNGCQYLIISASLDCSEFGEKLTVGSDDQIQRCEECLKDDSFKLRDNFLDVEFLKLREALTTISQPLTNTEIVRLYYDKTIDNIPNDIQIIAKISTPEKVGLVVSQVGTTLKVAYKIAVWILPIITSLLTIYSWYNKQGFPKRNEAGKGG